MKELQISFKGRGETRGFSFTQVKAGQNAYIYSVLVSPGVISHFEVFKRVENERFGCVSYPGSNAFGVWAWTHKTYDSAMRRFNELEGDK